MRTETMQATPEIWGGVECSIIRLRNRWRDELSETGHAGRLDDLDRIRQLGIRTLRYPLLWESISPDNIETADFAWHDKRMPRLKELGIEVIAGLLHHGSGPRYTNLLDPAFPELLARHARRVAERYPEIRRFTPVNEPLTTARFSALYGHWYPHRRHLPDFARALINQCRGVALAMRAIREVTPHAALVQTEDLGKTFSTPLLGYQADYENERRWLTFDLLFGRVERSHPWFSRLIDHGIPEQELQAFVDEPCPPDIVGVNYYPTSERFLDHRCSKLPAGASVGGNGRHHYADLEAVRMHLPLGSDGPEPRLREVCARYDRPVAVTEVHHGCSRDEQLRWLNEVWSAANRLAGEGKNIAAVTVWALFGCVDWNSLLLRKDGAYEAGAFDVRSPSPRMTALGSAVREMAGGAGLKHPVLDSPGWWRRDTRFFSPPFETTAERSGGGDARKVLILCKDAALGSAFCRIAAHRGLEFIAFPANQMDITDPHSMRRLLLKYRPWAFVHAATPQGAEAGPVGSIGTSNGPADGAVLASVCAAAGVALMTVTSDALVGKTLTDRLVESSPITPASGIRNLNAAAETMVMKHHPAALVIRTSAVFGPWNTADVLSQLLDEIAADRSLRLPADAVCSPTYLPDLAHAALDLLIDGETGIWHLANDGAVSWSDWAREVAQSAGLDARLVLGDHGRGVLAPAALASERGQLMPSLASGMGRFLRECDVRWNKTSAALGS
ncbi:sugar nucleotide-binding protein [Mesorhizobium sp. CO1-1-7]|uniref:sugar nucleotide-binding protein n=1 Tax=unclassified Mesorhizobium TaxID=325217 RepID=UPI001CD0BAD4|nr:MULTISPECIES: sugar nucleotide-binding protein [unclassified Mesorhizobium]MBZ9748182.1 sugar nucleotide-binding protein [Mesorhizobium sp. CO1-1-7]